MAIQLNKISGEEFVKKVLNGERDFSKTELKNFDLSAHESYSELQDYLKKQNFENAPLNINGSNFSYIKARGLYLPYLRGIEANLRRADLGGADFEGAYLRGTYLGGADLRETNLRRADLGGADFEVAELVRADLRGIKNLENTINLNLAIFFETKVTEKEKKIIEKKLAELKRFIVI